MTYAELVQLLNDARGYDDDRVYVKFPGADEACPVKEVLVEEFAGRNILTIVPDDDDTLGADDLPEEDEVEAEEGDAAAEPADAGTNPDESAGAPA